MFWLHIPSAAIRIMLARCTKRKDTLLPLAHVSSLSCSSGDRVMASATLMQENIQPHSYTSI